MRVAGLVFVALAVVAFGASLVMFFRGGGAAPGGAQQESGLTDITKLIEAITKLVAALQKAGPAIALLVASLVFATLGTSLLTADKVSADAPAVVSSTK